MNTVYWYLIISMVPTYRRIIKNRNRKSKIEILHATAIEALWSWRSFLSQQMSNETQPDYRKSIIYIATTIDMSYSQPDLKDRAKVDLDVNNLLNRVNVYKSEKRLETAVCWNRFWVHSFSIVWRRLLYIRSFRQCELIFNRKWS